MRIFLYIIFLSLGIIAFTVLLKRTYDIGFIRGYSQGSDMSQGEIDNLMALVRNGAVSYKKSTPGPSPTPKTAVATAKPQAIEWNGPQLWESVNKRRVQLGVSALSQRDELCTIASIRLNQLLQLGKLDGHEGFSKLPDERPDLEWIFEKYNLSEFLVSGASTPEESVSLWENTLGHKKLLTGGEYVWGCVYAQNTFAVAIAAY